STDHDLGNVIVHGDLGQIDAGDATWTTTGLESLTVRSLGRFGMATQELNGNLESFILGGLGALAVKSDIAGANIYAAGADHGKLGRVDIAGSIIGGSTPNSGQVRSTGAMGPVTISGDIVGGTGSFAGSVYSDDMIGPVTVGGSLLGGAG